MRKFLDLSILKTENETNLCIHSKKDVRNKMMDEFDIDFTKFKYIYACVYILLDVNDDT